jgi:hypothetical protein
MAVITGIGKRVLELYCLVPLECRFVALSTDMALLAFEQPLIITGMRRVTSHTAIVTVSNQMVVG